MATLMTVETYNEIQMAGLKALFAHYEAEKERRRLPLLDRSVLVSKELVSPQNDETQRDLCLDVLADKSEVL